MAKPTTPQQFEHASRLSRDQAIADLPRGALVIARRTGLSESTVRKILKGTMPRPADK